MNGCSTVLTERTYRAEQRLPAAPAFALDESLTFPRKITIFSDAVVSPVFKKNRKTYGKQIRFFIATWRTSPKRCCWLDRNFPPRMITTLTDNFLAARLRLWSPGSSSGFKNSSRVNFPYPAEAANFLTGGKSSFIAMSCLLKSITVYISGSRQVRRWSQWAVSSRQKWANATRWPPAFTAATRFSNTWIGAVGLRITDYVSKESRRKWSRWWDSDNAPRISDDLRSLTAFSGFVPSTENQTKQSPICTRGLSNGLKNNWKSTVS